MAMNNIMSITTLELPIPRIPFAHRSQYLLSSSTHLSLSAKSKSPTRKNVSTRCFHVIRNNPITATGLLVAGIGLTVLGPEASAVELQELSEPANALSLPTWAVHVSSVVEWILAMALVWQYGEKSGYESWKGLSWGMVPLLGGALCACTWHFFYNSESLEVLVALQAALTVIGNATMCFAAFRIYKSGERSKNL